MTGMRIFWRGFEEKRTTKGRIDQKIYSKNPPSRHAENGSKTKKNQLELIETV